MCWHVHRRLRSNRILAPPQTRHSLLLCVELQTRLAVKCVGTAARNRFLVTSEGEHGELSQSVTIHTNQEGTELTGTGMGTLIPT